MAHYSRGHGMTFWVAATDAERVDSDPRGFAPLSGYAPVDGAHVVIEIDQGRIRPYALVAHGRTLAPSYMGRIKASHGSAGTLYRVEDIVDLNKMSKRVKRAKSTLVQHWLPKPDFPAPVMQLGTSKGWYWPDVQAYFKQVANKRHLGA